MKKRIAIDCRSLAWGHSGIARYLDNVIRQLTKIDSQNEYYLLSPFPLKTQYTGRNFHQVPLISHELVYKYVKTPQFLKRQKIDVYWSPTQDLPLQKIHHCKYIATIHDVAFEHDISPYGWKVRLLHTLGLYKRSAHIADCILTDSQYSKDDIVKTYQLDDKKVIVTYLGVGERFKPIDKKSAKSYVKKRFGLDRKYIFYINTGRPKNTLTAFQLLKEHDWKKKDITLVCLGKSVSSEENIDSLAQQMNISKDIMYIQEFISDEDLNNLYSGAELFVCPSYFEGFGLTPLEAMKSGASVLISNVTALPEVFKEAAIYCDPYNPQDIKKQIVYLYENGYLATKLQKQSRLLIEKYRWQNVADKILTTFNGK